MPVFLITNPDYKGAEMLYAILSNWYAFNSLFIANLILYISKRERERDQKPSNDPILKEIYVFQSVTRHLSFGGEVFWAGQHRKSGIGYAARYNTDKMVYCLQFIFFYHNIMS